MEKQVNSNIEQEKQQMFNKTTVFLTKFIFGDNFDMMKKAGFIDSYTSDPNIMNILTLGQNQRLLFLLFKNKKIGLEQMKKIVTDLAAIPVQIVFSYELVNDYSMIVVDFPEKYIQDYDFITQGKYSKLSDSFKDKFPVSREVSNSKGQRMGREYTIYYHIFNKTDWLKNVLMERLGLMELDDKLELWSSPDQTDLIFNVTKIM